MKKIAVFLSVIILVGCASTNGPGTTPPLERAMAPMNNIWNCYVSFSNRCGPQIASEMRGVQ